MVTFAWPWMFLLLPLPWLFRRLLRPSDQRDAALRVPHLAAFEALLPRRGRSTANRWLPLLALWLIWMALLTAAARPERLGDTVMVPVSGRDLMLAVDLSGSMNREDMVLNGRPASRLEVLKLVFDDFVTRRGGDRVGLILFATNAYLKAPLTFDLATVNRLMQETPLGIAGGRTAIGDGIGLAVKHLRDRPAQNRVLVLMTDGANNSGELEPIKAAELAAQAGIRIYTIGFGSDEMERPNLFGGAFGRRSLEAGADMDEDVLIEIASMTGGEYFRARHSEELLQIYRNLNALEPVPGPEETFRPQRPLFIWPLSVALFTSLLLGLLQGRRGLGGLL
ncbi:MAG: VWA domain-containing protein [Gammaproteobacteria bacterium]|nr:VWA domain-containing protein [Gammaproteobacteria bacterium]